MGTALVVMGYDAWEFYGDVSCFIYPAEVGQEEGTGSLNGAIRILKLNQKIRSRPQEQRRPAKPASAIDSHNLVIYSVGPARLVEEDSLFKTPIEKGN
jgi:hypothetical protein